MSYFFLLVIFNWLPQFCFCLFFPNFKRLNFCLRVFHARSYFFLLPRLSSLSVNRSFFIFSSHSDFHYDFFPGFCFLSRKWSITDISFSSFLFTFFFLPDNYLRYLLLCCFFFSRVCSSVSDEVNLLWWKVRSIKYYYFYARGFIFLTRCFWFKSFFWHDVKSITFSCNNRRCLASKLGIYLKIYKLFVLMIPQENLRIFTPEIRIWCKTWNTDPSLHLFSSDD